jgi:regulator of RNase E activity RraA
MIAGKRGRLCEKEVNMNNNLNTQGDINTAIIDKIRRNRISTTEIADCLGKTGVIAGVKPINQKKFRVGPVFWAYAYNESNWELHEQIRDFPEGHVIIAEAFDCGEKALFGELVSKFLILYRQAAAVVTIGYLRDVPHLIRQNWPIWCVGGTPIGCFNRKNEDPLDPDLVARRRLQYEGAIAVCDDSGVVVIPKEVQDAAFLEKLDWIEEQEDIWFDCIDRLKWDTYDTVCLKKYQESQP